MPTRDQVETPAEESHGQVGPGGHVPFALVAAERVRAYGMRRVTEEFAGGAGAPTGMQTP